jgi:hypothetical protein
MPMSQHRPALAAILVAVVAVLPFLLGGNAADAAPLPLNPIARAALAYDGTWQGECWGWVHKVVLEATGRTIGFDYRQGFFEAGAVEVAINEAQPGDIIQLARDSDTSPDADYPGLHTSIVLANLGNGLFDVIDSNQNFDGMVHQRPAYDPGAAAARYAVNVHIYRIGASPGLVPTVPLAAPLPGAAFVPGERARAYTPGDCLNLRSGPGREYPPLTCLSHGAAVTIISAAQTTDLRWVKVSTPAGEGWVAADYLSREPANASPTSAGTVGPVLIRRAFIALAAAD